MLGYIKKDFLMLKRDSIFFIPVILIFSIFLRNGVNFLSSIYIITIMFNLFTYEEKDNAIEYLCALPNGRKNMVISKYLCLILVCIIFTTTMTIVQIIVNMINSKEIFYGFDSNNFVYSFVPIIIMSIILPFIYLFGANRAKIFMFLIFFGIPLILAFVSMLFPGIEKYFLFFEDKAYLAILFLFVMYIISFFISLWVNSRKDY